MCFGRAFHLILMHLFCYIQCFEISFKKKSGFFSQKLFFLEFRLIQSNFRSLEILLQKFCEPLPGSIDRTCFFDQSRIVFQVFFLNSSLTISKHLFQKFFNFSSLSDLARQHYEFFVIFLQNFCKVFLPQSR